MAAIIDINAFKLLRATEAQHWQKIKNSQPQLKIYWSL